MAARGLPLQREFIKLFNTASSIYTNNMLIISFSSCISRRLGDIIAHMAGTDSTSYVLMFRV
jgi:hypothetical protein